jgi:phage-related tail fiber protein
MKAKHCGSLTLAAGAMAALLLAVGFAPSASATITFQASNTLGVNVFQQQQNDPCVIGDQSCQEPAGFTFNSWSGTPNAQGGTYDLFSPVYQAISPFSDPSSFSGQHIPTSFTIGVDENISAGAGNEILQFFKVWDCTGPVTAGTFHAGGGNNSNVAQCTAVDVGNSFTTVTTIPNMNNGNGFSDFILTGFSLTPGNFYEFEASVSADTDGMEEFFIIPAGQPAFVPEPGTLMLFGSGLIGIAGLVRRRFTR